MVKIDKIYTRGGDKGDTSLVGGKRVKKNNPRVKCYGELDELNCFIGWARTISVKLSEREITSELSKIQNEIFDIGAYLASPAESDSSKVNITEAEISRLENWIDKSVKNLPELQSFVLPGGNDLNAALHIARAVCRRTERSLIDLGDNEKVEPIVLKYLNRLSDYLFAISRLTCFNQKSEELLWQIPFKQN